MKTQFVLIGTLVIETLAPANRLSGAGFQNLDFEAANVPITSPGQFGGYVSANAALPGWTVWIGSNQTSQVLHNNLSLGTAVVNIFGPNLFDYVIEGRYSVGFYPGTDPDNSLSLVTVSLGQTGLIPSGTKSLLFTALFTPNLPGAENRMGVFVDDQRLNVVALETGVGFTTYAADVSAYANQERLLRFTAYSPFCQLDSIRFEVPEATPLVFALWGGLLFGTFRVVRRLRK